MQNICILIAHILDYKLIINYKIVYIWIADWHIYIVHTLLGTRVKLKIRVNIITI